MSKFTVVLLSAGLVLLAWSRCDGPKVVEPPDPVDAPALVTPETTTTVPTTTTTMPPDEDHHEEVEGAGQGNPVEQRWPIVALLPHVTQHWRVDYRLDGERLLLTGTIRVILNRGDQLPQARLDYQTYRAEATAWLAENGANGVPVTWTPASP